ncbi:DUF3413 domain-containing protein [Orbaceae bacterium ESL0721]|nr:DUF3413 domain-containing protein [Orbaceae bacterium ESL0721]
MLKLKNSHLKDDRASQIVSWGHWFTLFNIFVVTILGSRYLFIADWPPTFMGRFYGIISTIGHFSFLSFIVYLILVFPFSFFIGSSRAQRIIAVAVATVGITLLLIDTQVFLHFRMHLNVSIWNILTSTGTSFLNHTFIFIPLILAFEILFSIWSWKKLRSLNKRRRYAKPVVIIVILCFVSSHLIHLWADANFYRPITMQRSSLPLSNPLTARHLLERYGFIGDDYQTRMVEEGNPSAIAVEYPLGKIAYTPNDSLYDVLMVIVDNWNRELLTHNMPLLTEFAKQNINFTNHYGASTQPYLNNFSLFYGIDPNYYNSILTNHKSSALLDTFVNEHYNLGLFSVDGFAQPLYRHALLSNFTLPDAERQSNRQITDYWLAWSDEQNQIQNRAPLFSIVQFELTMGRLSDWESSAKSVDHYIDALINRIKQSQRKTVIIITGSNGITIDEAKKTVLASRENKFAREQLRVPLIIAWPDKKAEEVSFATTHTDVMRTLMQDALNVITPAQQYSQGFNLFNRDDNKLSIGKTVVTRTWLIAGNENEIAALYADKTVVIDAFGRTKIYDLNNRVQKREQVDLSQFLQIITENRRFMVLSN